ncbi:sensor histidine kinase [Enterococcus casseliflavus]
MSLKRKLSTIYFVITVLLFLLVSGYFVFSNSNKLKDEAYEGLTNYTETIKQQYQLQLASYDQAVTNLLSDKDLLLDLRTLSYLEREDKNTLTLERSYRRITEKISNYSNLSEFYRVNVITSKNDFLTNDIKLSSQQSAANEKAEALLQNADYHKGVYLVPNFQDVWSNSGQYLFAYMRQVNYPNGEYVYLQVEGHQEKLAELLSLNADSQMSFYILDQEHKLVAYSDEGDLAQLQRYLKKHRGKTFEGALVHQVSLENGQKIVAFQDLTAVNSTILSTSFYLVLLSVALLIVLFLIFRNRVNKLLNPLEELKAEMENLNITTLPQNSEITSDEDEITALSDSYNQLKNRLNLAIENELVAQRKQFEANMEVLQAQVNPHFIYNIMNIVAYKGLEYEDQDTVEIAQGITEMLRYSTSNIEKQATFKAEFAHVENYLLLMKKRYQEYLSYEIHLPERFNEVPIPKLVLQIFAENSIKYGFESGQEQVTLSISVEDASDVEWKIEVSDNGPGITSDKQHYLEKKIREIDEALRQGDSLERLEFEIGGLGIINTYARLRLFYGPSFHLTIEKQALGSKIVLWKGSQTSGTIETFID